MIHKNLKLIIERGDFRPFWDVYVTESRFFAAEIKKKFYIPSPKEYKVCRFCQRDSKTTSFKMDAHVVPEFLGNKYLLSHFECDECNSLFSKYETDLSNYLGIWRTLSMLNGKTGVPKFKPKSGGDGEKIEVTFNPDERLLNFRISGINESEIESIKISEDSALTINTTRPSHIPRNALKALIKIAFCMLHPDNLKNYDRTRQWLINEFADKSILEHPFFQIYQNQGLLLPSPMVLLAKKKDEFKNMPIPPNALLLFYGIFKYQIFLPFHNDEDELFKNVDFCLPIEEHLAGKIDTDKNTVDINLIDFSSTKMQRNEPHLIKFNTIARNPKNSTGS